MDGLPEHGKIVVASPATAVRMVDAAPEHAHRVFAQDGLADDKAYVIDIDEMNRSLWDASDRRDEVPPVETISNRRFSALVFRRYALSATRFATVTATDIGGAMRK